MAYSSWIQSGNELVNTFGDSKRSHFYLKTLYKYERNGNTVNYIVRLELNYVNDQGGTGSYGWNMGVKAVCNGSSDPGYQWISGGGTWSNGANVGAKEFSFSITNTTGTGTVPIASAAQNTDRNSFDAPGSFKVILEYVIVLFVSSIATVYVPSADVYVPFHQLAFSLVVIAPSFAGSAWRA